MEKSNKKILCYIMIETNVREFLAKLLLACIAVEEGFNVVFGEKTSLRKILQYLPKGIVVEKGIDKDHIEFFKKYKILGHKIVAWDEEGLVYLNRNLYHSQKISREALNMIDLFFSWGSVQAEDINLIDSFNNSSKIIITGNPRFDLLRSKLVNVFTEKSEILKKSYGPFILINSNFSFVNHFYGKNYCIKELKNRGFLSSFENEIFYCKFEKYQEKIFQAFTEALSKISCIFKNYNIILRPHPSENIQTWRDKTLNLPNVQVLSQGNVIPWIMASDLMIHNSCTTGVEAYLLKKPVIAYCPYTSKSYDQFLPNVLSYKTYNIKELVEIIRKTINSKLINCKKLNKNNNYKSKIAKKYISSLDGPLASDIIVASLKSLNVFPKTLESSCLQKISQLNNRDIFIEIKNIVKKIIRPNSCEAYLQQKFPEVKLEETQYWLDKLKYNTGRFSNIKIKQISKNIFFATKN